jgi:hypothetical protein
MENAWTVPIAEAFAQCRTPRTEEVYIQRISLLPELSMKR